ncbi:hypothetical protein MRX96_051386, partial [Rhipicephalus microplus]
MLNPLLTLQMLVCFIATGVCPFLQDKLGSTYPPAPRNLAWETGPPLDAPDPAAPPKPAQWPPYSWQPRPSMTSPVTWPVSPLQKPPADAVSLGARHRTPHHAQPASDFADAGVLHRHRCVPIPSRQARMNLPPCAQELSLGNWPALDAPDPAARQNQPSGPLQLATKPIDDIT